MIIIIMFDISIAHINIHKLISLLIDNSLFCSLKTLLFSLG